MPFTDVFGGSTIYPSDTTYLALEVTADIQLEWPIEQAIAGRPIVADIVDLDPAGPGFNVDLPDARQVANGYTALFNNVGADTVTIRDNAGATLVSLASGTVWQLYLTDNSTEAGSWRVFQYGASVSVTNAAALAGAGLKAITTTLNQSIPNRSESSTPVTIINSDRAMLVIWTGGVGDVDLPSAGSVGSDWFFQLRNSGSGDLTVTPPSGSIDGDSSKTFPVGTSAILVTDGTDYFTLGFGSGAGGGSSFDFVSINVAGSGNFTLTGAQLNRIAYEFTGVLTGDRDIIVPGSIQEYWVTNNTTGAFVLVVRTVAQAPGIEVLQGDAAILYCNGTEVVDADSSSVSFPIPVAQGGTGAANAAGARTNLGLSYAAPSATVGPTSTTGATNTVMDAGSAPAINLTVAYPWTNTHSITNANPIYRWVETGVTADEGVFQVSVQGEQVLFQLGTDALAFTSFMVLNRLVAAATDITWVVATSIFQGNARPEADGTRDLGSATVKWSSVFANVHSLGTNKQALTDAANVLTIASGSAWTGVTLSTTGNFTVGCVDFPLTCSDDFLLTCVDLTATVTTFTVNGISLLPLEGTFTATYNGITGPPTATCRYTRIGNKVTLFIEAVTDLSDGTNTFTITGLPAAIQPTRVQGFVVLATNSSAASLATVSTGAGTGTLTLRTGGSFLASSWTTNGSLNKGISACAITYLMN